MFLDTIWPSGELFAFQWFSSEWAKAASRFDKILTKRTGNQTGTENWDHSNNERTHVDKIFSKVCEKIREKAKVYSSQKRDFGEGKWFQRFKINKGQTKAENLSF